MDSLLKIAGLLGIGGLISSYFTLLWQRKNEDTKARQEYKETRYKCVVLLMKALLYASTKSSIKALGSFINDSNKNTLVNAVIEMRKDLWKLKGTLISEDLA